MIMNFLRPTWIEVNLEAVSHNIKQIKSKLSPGIQLLAIVKANGYGNGAVEVAHVCIDEGVNMLGVALIEEAIELREAGIKLPILVMGSIYPFDNYKKIIEYDLIPTVASIESGRKLVEICRAEKAVCKVHVKIDTGMGRIGVVPSSAVSLVKFLVSSKELELEGIYSHLASADSDSYFTEKQIVDFSKLLDMLRIEKIDIMYKHIANSAAIQKYKESHYNMVRPGLSLYGLLPFAKEAQLIDLKNVMSWKTRIIFLKKVPIQTSISYGRTFVTKRESLIATIPVGYADGFSRFLSNKGEVLVKGKRAPIVGRVCMDMCMLDVTDVGGVRVGNEVVLIGKQGDETITVEDVASIIGTINYEVVCNISKRVPRVYIGIK